MTTYAPSIDAELEREDRPDVAPMLYKSLVAHYPDRLIILCDDRARVLAQTGGSLRRSDTSAVGG